MLKFIASFILMMVFFLASSINTMAVPVGHLVINEIQTNGIGTGTTEQEFIEIHNPTDQTVDISDWYLRYYSSSGISSTAKKILTISQGTKIYPNGNIIFAPAGYLPGNASIIRYTTNSSFGGISYDGATIDLVDTQDDIVDRLGWGVKASILSETMPAVAPKYGQSISRKIDDSNIVDTDNNNLDFEAVIIPNPETSNIAPILPDPTPVDSPQTPDPITNPVADSNTASSEQPSIDTTVSTSTDNTTPSTNIDQSNVTNATDMLPPVINELMIDPASPLSDANDEWVEIYNPNNSVFDLAGYKVLVGDNLSYKYTFTYEKIPANGYVLVTSKDTPISLSNSGSRVVIQDSAGQNVDDVSYQKAETGSSYARDSNGEWKWTITPTANADNVITYSVATTVEAVKKSTAIPKSQKTTTPKTDTKKTSTVAKVTSTTTPKAKAKTTTTKGATTQNQDEQLVATPNSIPAPILATIALLAVLYLGYEYRFEISNRFNQLKNYRANRPNTGR